MSAPYTDPIEVVSRQRVVQVLALTFGRARIVTWKKGDPFSLLDGY